MSNLSTQEVVSSIEKSPLKELHGIQYQEYQKFFGNEYQLPALDDKKFTKLESQEKKARRRLDYDDNLIKKFKMLFMNSKVIGALENKFGLELEFDSADIWIDDRGYFLEPHTDDSRIKLALQIYLGEDNKGTSLYDGDRNMLYTFPFKFGSGYALFNNVYSRHGLEPVENDGRTSVYVRYR